MLWDSAALAFWKSRTVTGCICNSCRIEDSAELKHFTIKHGFAIVILLSANGSSQGHFPEADKDPVIQIANIVTVQGAEEPIVRNVMTLDTCAPIVGAEVMSFSSEDQLLRVSSCCLTFVCLSPTLLNSIEG